MALAALLLCFAGNNAERNVYRKQLSSLFFYVYNCCLYVNAVGSGRYDPPLIGSYLAKSRHNVMSESTFQPDPFCIKLSILSRMVDVFFI